MMDEDELDPRIQVELEKLNSATDVINKLEIELDEANTTFRMLLNECTRRLKVHSSKHGSAIESARPYYEALDIARRAQQECQQAAVSFQRANEVHEAAKETVALAESRFMSQQPEWRFDSAWQEMLNHATIKVRDAEKQRAESSAHHGRATARYKEAQDKVHTLEQRLRRNVARSRPYFEEKHRCNDQLAAQKVAVESLAARVAGVKAGYAESLRRLEAISEEIHRRRGDAARAEGCGVREPGVGAELEYAGEQENREASPYDKSGDIATLQHSNIATPRHSDIVTLQRSDIATPRHSDIATAESGGSGKDPGMSLDGPQSLRLRSTASRDDDDAGSESEDDDKAVATDVSADLLAGFAFPPGPVTSGRGVGAADSCPEDAGGDGGDGGPRSSPDDSEPPARRPDLEIAYQLDKTRLQQDNDRDAALELPANTQDSVIPAALRDVPH